ncbi:MAG: hypothetical protein R2761_05800 [Acidimicrobiales bacterium]
MSRFGRLLLGAATLVLVVAGCGRSPGPSGSPEIDGTAYIAALRPFLPRPASAAPGDKRDVVFVVPLDGNALPLQAQIDVVGAFADDYDVRFVDDMDAAIDERGARKPPQEGGLLIGMGPVTSEPPHTTRIELYWNADRIEGHLVTLATTSDGWQVTGDEPVTPEALARHA